MRKGIVAALGLLSASSIAGAATVHNTNVTPGWNVGSGQFNGNFVVSTENGTELGLRAQTRFVGPIADADMDGVYYAVPGISSGVDNATWNFDYSANLGTRSTSNTILMLYIDTDPTAAQSFTPVALNILFPNTSLAQDSSNLGFWAPPLTFNPNVNGIYSFRFDATDSVSGALINRVAMDVSVGGTPPAPVPTPMAATAGFGLMGGLLMKRRGRLVVA